MASCAIMVSRNDRPGMRRGEASGIYVLPKPNGFGKKMVFPEGWLHIIVTDQSKQQMTFLQVPWKRDFILTFFSQTPTDVKYRFEVDPDLVASPSGNGGAVLNDRMNQFFEERYRGKGTVGGTRNRITEIPKGQVSLEDLAGDFNAKFHGVFDKKLWFMTEAEVLRVEALGGVENYTRDQINAVFLSKLKF